MDGKQQKENKQISSCCASPVTVSHGCDSDAGHLGKPCDCGDGVTQWWECSSCHKACNVKSKETQLTCEKHARILIGKRMCVDCFTEFMQRGGDSMDSVPTKEGAVFELLREAFEKIKACTPSREMSLVVTKLEEAMMWLNKDRTIKGEFTPNETHVQK